MLVAFVNHLAIFGAVHTIFSFDDIFVPRGSTIFSSNADEQQCRRVAVTAADEAQTGRCRRTTVQTVPA